MDRIHDAIMLFEKKYGKTPDELGFPVVSVYEKQRVFLYATSVTAVDAYKRQQNIIRWMFKWALWPLIILLSLISMVFANNHDLTNPVFIVLALLAFLWWVAMLILCFIGKQTQKYVKLDENIIYLHYE